MRGLDTDTRGEGKWEDDEDDRASDSRRRGGVRRPVENLRGWGVRARVGVRVRVRVQARARVRVRVRVRLRGADELTVYT